VAVDSHSGLRQRVGPTKAQHVADAMRDRVVLKRGSAQELSVNLVSPEI
jgi:hypothetical protein